MRRRERKRGRGCGGRVKKTVQIGKRAIFCRLNAKTRKGAYTRRTLDSRGREGGAWCVENGRPGRIFAGGNKPWGEGVAPKVLL